MRPKKDEDQDNSQDEYQATENGDEEDEEIHPDDEDEDGNVVRQLNGHDGSVIFIIIRNQRCFHVCIKGHALIGSFIGELDLPKTASTRKRNNRVSGYDG